MRSYATTHPCHGFRRAWAAGYDERREVNKKEIHRLWREKALQVEVHIPGKPAGVSSMPPIEADAPTVRWGLIFQAESTIDGKAGQDRVDDRRTYPGLAAEHRRAVDHR